MVNGEANQVDCRRLAAASAARMITFQWDKNAGGDAGLTPAGPGREAQRLSLPTPGAWVRGDRMELQVPNGAVESIPLASLHLAGRHNVQNALAALIGARLFGVDIRTCERALGSFRGLPHRMELVAEVAGVRFYNDSKATNVGSVLGSLTGFDSPVVLIAGGKDKGGDYAPLVPLLRTVARHVVLIGAAADRMEKALTGVLPLHRAPDLPTAVTVAAGLAQPGDAVVLSPACSSYDMFKNYEERGHIFAEAVRRLKGGT